MKKILIKNADIVTVNEKKEILSSFDILIEDNKISKIAKNIEESADKIIDATGKVVLPGFIQTHIHLCQTLFRGMAEDRQLMEWLRERIWPFEAVHDENSTYNSAMLGLGEMLLGGTTTILDMGGVNHQNKIFEAIEKSGMRAFAGKAMMDSGIGVPDAILETTDNSIKESMELYQKWDGVADGRIRYAFAPRFILSCTDDLFKEVGKLSNQYDILVHTHAYENETEGEEVFELKGAREFEYFDKYDLLNERFLAAHCVWLNDNDLKLMRENNVKALHCPSSNFKLGSGMCNLPRLLDNDICVSIGADGAPCNNNLDMLQEVKTTAIMQNVINQPGCLDAHKYIELATIEGAKTLGIEQETGSIEEGKKADLIIMNLENDFHCWNSHQVDIPTKIVYSSNSSNVETVLIDGQLVVEDKNLKTINKAEIIKGSAEAIKRILG